MILRALIALVTCTLAMSAERAPVVYAATSTADAIQAIATAWERQTGVAPRLSFASSSTLARQIEEGAEVDVFLSANQIWMDRLSRGMDLKRRSDLLTNSLVLIAAKPGKRSIANLASMGTERLAMGDPAHVPAGMYAKQALESEGIWQRLAKQQRVYCRDVRAALRLVMMGEVAVAIVYATDAATTPKVNVVDTFNKKSHDPIKYPVTLLTNDPEASAFYAFLFSQQARAIFASYGFQPPESVVTQGQSVYSQETPQTGSVLRNAFLVSLKVALLSLALIAGPGIVLGRLLARRRFRGKALLEALVYAPLVLPPVITGYLLLLTFGRKGLIGQLLDAWLGISLAFNLMGAVLAAAVMSFPLLVRSARLGFELVDPGLETAAATLGASPLNTFFRVTLPLALPGILTGLMLAFARGLGEFGATIIFAGNIEGETRSIPLAVFTLLQQPGQERTVFVLALLAIGLSILALTASDWGSRRLTERIRGPQ